MTFCEQHAMSILYMFDIQGMNTVEIAKALGKNRVFYKAVSRFLHSCGRQLSHRQKRTPKNIKELLTDLYTHQKFTCAQIADEYGHIFGDTANVQLMLDKLQIKKRRCGFESYTKNITYFDSIDSETKAYYLGLLMADGCVTDKGTISLGLIEPDKYLIERLRDELNTCVKIQVRKKENHEWANYDMYRICFANQHMVNTLAKYGIVPRKSNNEKVPLSPLSPFISHFIRGYFDGDGTVFVSNEHLRFAFYGSRDLCQWIINYYHFHVNVFDKGTICTFSVQNRNDVRRFYDSIYSNASIYMIRKRHKFDSVIQDM